MRAPAATIAALEAAAASGSLDGWLALLPDDRSRAYARRALEIDRRLWTGYPASIASCLLARTLGAEGFSDLHRALCRELDERGSPWARPLRALPVAPGLVAELHGGDWLDLHDLQVPTFESDHELVMVPYRFHPSGKAPEARRRDRLRWSWSRGEARLEPDPRAGEPLRRDRYPRVESDGWGPAFLVRAPDAPRILLPCPEEGSAGGHVSADGARVYVYGTLDEYAGGFVFVLDAGTLAVTRRLSTARPVGSVHECDREDLVLVRDHDHALFAWIGDEARALSPTAKEACLSPSGRYLATRDDGVRVWTLADVGGAPPARGLDTRFDPSGDRLLSGTRLHDGHTGAPIGTIDLSFGHYLEGGPAWPWFHLGVRHLICTHDEARVYDTRNGERLAVAEPWFFPQWFTLAYDRAGETVAALRRGEPICRLYEIPSGRLLSQIPLAGTALALSAGADLVAARSGLEVEVRSTPGELRRRFAHSGGQASNSFDHGDSSLRFSMDGGTVASFVEGDGWRVWSLDDDRTLHLADRRAIDTLPGFAPPRPREWDVEAGSATIFVHRPTGTRIALPAAGPWVHNPARPEITASDALHVELRAR